MGFWKWDFKSTREKLNFLKSTPQIIRFLPSLPQLFCCSLSRAPFPYYGSNSLPNFILFPNSFPKHLECAALSCTLEHGTEMLLDSIFNILFHFPDFFREFWFCWPGGAFGSQQSHAVNWSRSDWAWSFTGGLNFFWEPQILMRIWIFLENLKFWFEDWSLFGEPQILMFWGFKVFWRTSNSDLRIWVLPGDLKSQIPSAPTAPGSHWCWILGNLDMMVGSSPEPHPAGLSLSYFLSYRREMVNCNLDRIFMENFSKGRAGTGIPIPGRI